MTEIVSRPARHIPLTAWTPTDASGAGLTFAAGTNGSYSVTGDVVSAWGEVIYPATADASNATIGGLPFTCANSQGVRGGVTIGFKTESTLAGALVVNNTKTLGLNTSTGANITNATMSGDTVYFLAVYPLVL